MALLAASGWLLLRAGSINVQEYVLLRDILTACFCLIMVHLCCCPVQPALVYDEWDSVWLEKVLKFDLVGSGDQLH